MAALCELAPRLRIDDTKPETPRREGTTLSSSGESYDDADEEDEDDDGDDESSLPFSLSLYYQLVIVFRADGRNIVIGFQ
jgi:hypothetical protein